MRWVIDHWQPLALLASFLFLMFAYQLHINLGDDND